LFWRADKSDLDQEFLVYTVMLILSKTILIEI
jgi:hypothetical protein